MLVSLSSHARCSCSWSRAHTSHTILQGPGIAIRILGEVTPAQVKIVQQADAIFIEEIKKAGLYRKISQGRGFLFRGRGGKSL